MSYTETHFGTIERVHINISLEEWCENYCHEHMIDKDSYHDNWTECCIDLFIEDDFHEYIILNNKLYRLTNHVELDEGDYCKSLRNGDEITFCTSFYNGSTCLSEILEDLVEKYEI